ncbi:uncharacterized protein LOC115220379 [Octopus sinensis]|uniref:Uncharacterized protein LOC115220379 n=1 Tax=Octopus sinensis TaxID=2607531 RepID=A0A7E6FFF3_9MOLL|nr:uncharacterized protein LOC115220379 [Octopus sinensis]
MVSEFSGTVDNRRHDELLQITLSQNKPKSDCSSNTSTLSGSVFPCKFDKSWHRDVIKYLFKEGFVPKDIHVDLLATLGVGAPGLSTMQTWAAQCRRKDSLGDDPMSAYPGTATSVENIDCVHLMVMDTTRLTKIQIANSISTYCEKVENIVHNELGMMKVFARSMSHVLTPDQSALG